MKNHYEEMTENIEKKSENSMEFLKEKLNSKSTGKVNLLEMAIKFGKRRKKLEDKK